MPTITWELKNTREPHTIHLNHHTYTGLREISVDGVRIERKRSVIDHGSRHFIQIEGEEYELVISTNGVTFAYFLVEDQQPIPSIEDLYRGKNAAKLLKSRYLKDIPFWQDLSRQLHLPYLPKRDDLWAYRHRLLGFIDGYLVLFQKNFVPETWLVVVRHQQMLPDGAGAKIHSDTRIQELLGRSKKSKEMFYHAPDLTLIRLPIIKKETPEMLAQRVRTFLAVVSEQARPLPEGMCENQQCTRRFTTDRKLVLVNGMPRLFCPECTAAVPEWGQRTQADYQKAPDNLLSGIIVGSGVALVCALLWAVLGIWAARVTLAVPIITFSWTVRQMDKVGTKRTLRSLTVALILAMISVVLGHLATVFLIQMRIGYPISVATLIRSITLLIDDPGLPIVALIFTVFLSGLEFWNVWRATKDQLSDVFSPAMDVLPGNY